MLLFIRIIQGICVGFYSAIIPVIIKEISPNEISGTLGALNQLFIAFGVFFSFFFKFIL
jgi:SP family arabinose:H+ symporter-like MFS transporter